MGARRDWGNWKITRIQEIWHRGSERKKISFFFSFIQYFEMEQLVLANGRRGKEAPGNN